MSRYRSQSSYQHSVQSIGFGCFRLSWVVDRYIKGSRLRWPTTYGRDTNRAGAERFCKRHQVSMPRDTAKGEK